jgi:TolA-binding protein
VGADGVPRSPQATDRAIEIFRVVIERFPQSEQVSWAKLDMAEAYIDKSEMGDPEKNIPIARALLEEFIASYPNHERAERALKLLGWCYEQLGDKQTALAQYEKAVAAYPTNHWTPACLERAIELQQEFGRWDDAIASARKYIASYPGGKSAQAQLAIGVCSAAKGNNAQAIIEFGKLVAEYPTCSAECAAALFQKAFIHKSLGQVGLARAALQHLVQAYPSEQFAAEAQRQLSQLAAE